MHQPERKSYHTQWGMYKISLVEIYWRKGRRRCGGGGNMPPQQLFGVNIMQLTRGGGMLNKLMGLSQEEFPTASAKYKSQDR